jgi:hypothetical protein
MSEATFRTVVASVLVAALALAVIAAVVVFVQRPSEPLPSASMTSSAAPSPLHSPAPTQIPQRSLAPTRIPDPVFVAPGVVSVGQISRGAGSGTTLVLEFIESSVDAIPNAAGSFRVTLSDHAGDGSTVGFIGTPSVAAPGSLGATAILVAPNALMVSIVASDIYNVESITISGLGLGASATAAIGSVNAELKGFTGSLASGAASNILASPGSVIASP